MAFFEPPPPPPPPPEPFRRPDWMRPDDVLGEAVPINFVLARTPKTAVTVQHITAYPSGFEFEVVAAARPEGEIWDPMHGLAGFRGRPGQRGGEMGDEILRFGIQYSDGSKATNLGPPMIGPQDRRRKRPILQHQGGSGGGTIATQRYWADLIREAAKRAIELWPENAQ